MNRIPSGWSNDPEDTCLDLAIETTLSHPIDELAVARVKNRAYSIPFDRQVSMPMADTSKFSEAIMNVQPSPVTNRLPKTKVLAALAASIAIVVWWTTSSSLVAIAQIADSINAISSVRFHYSTSTLGQAANEGAIEIRDQVIRYDHGRRVHVFDHANRKAVALDTQQMAWQEFDLSQLPAPVINPLAELVAARERAAKSLGSEWRDGRKLSVYEMKDFGLLDSRRKGTITMWLNEETNLPVRIELRDPNPKFKTVTIFDQFTWDPDLPQDHFALSMPAGYQPGEIEPAFASAPTGVQLTKGQDLESGILYSGRVPGWIEVDRERKLLTAILRDKEGSKSNMPTELRQWDLSTGKIRWTKFVGGAVKFGLQAEKSLLALIEGQEIQVRDAATGEVTRTMETEHAMGFVSFDKTGSRLANAYIDWGGNQSNPKGGVELWNLTSGALERTLDIGDRVELAVFRPDGLVVAAASQGNIRFYRTDTGKLEQVLAGTTRIAYSPDGEELAFASIEQAMLGVIGKVMVADAASYAIDRTLTMQGGKGRSWPLGLDFSPNGQRLAACDWNGAINVWSLVNGDAIPGVESLDSGVHCVRFIDDNHIATGSEDGTLKIHDLSK